MSGIVGIVSLDGTPVDRAVAAPDDRLVGVSWPRPTDDLDRRSGGLRPYAAPHHRRIGARGATGQPGRARVDYRGRTRRWAGRSRRPARIARTRGSPGGKRCATDSARVSRLGRATASSICWATLPLRSGTGGRAACFALATISASSRSTTPRSEAASSSATRSIAFVCIPGLATALNELAIGDFLLFGYNYEPTTTTFADVRRLAPAHSLTCGHGTAASQAILDAAGRRSDPIPPFARLRRSFHGDPAGRCGRPAPRRPCGHLDERGARFDVHRRDRPAAPRRTRRLLRASCPYHRLRSLIPDEERHYARMAAEALGIEISYFVADDHGPLDGWDRPDLRTPEPMRRSVSAHAQATAGTSLRRTAGSCCVEKAVTRSYGVRMWSISWAGCGRWSWQPISRGLSWSIAGAPVAVSDPR